MHLVRNQRNQQAQVEQSSEIRKSENRKSDSQSSVFSICLEIP